MSHYWLSFQVRRLRHESLILALTLGGITGVVVGLVYRNTVPFELGLSTVVGSIMGFWLFRKQWERQSRPAVLSANASRFLGTLFAATIAVAMAMFHAHGPQIYLLFLLSFAWLVLAILMLGSAANRYGLVAVVFGLALISRFFVFYGLDTIVGVDSWYHLDASQGMISSGHVLTAGTYAFYPLFHIQTALTSELLGVGLRDSIFIAGGLSETASILFVYLVGRHLVNEKAGRLASFVAAVLAW